MIIVSNTGPLLHLHEAGCLELLNLAGEVHIPSIIETELSRRLPDFRLPAWIKINPLNRSLKRTAMNWQQAGILDPGEAEALCLAQQLGSQWFLTDDTAARLLGNTLNIEVHGSLGVILWAAASGHIQYPEAKENLDKLINSSLWMSPRIISESKTALETLFPKT